MYFIHTIMRSLVNFNLWTNDFLTFNSTYWKKCDRVVHHKCRGPFKLKIGTLLLFLVPVEILVLTLSQVFNQGLSSTSYSLITLERTCVDNFWMLVKLTLIFKDILVPNYKAEFENISL